MFLLQISPSHLNLGYRSFYTEKSRFAKIYRQFMRDLVWALTNRTLMIDADVNAIFHLEKEIAKVNLLEYFVLDTFIVHMYISVPSHIGCSVCWNKYPDNSQKSFQHNQ